MPSLAFYIFVFFLNETDTRKILPHFTQSFYQSQKQSLKMLFLPFYSSSQLHTFNVIGYDVGILYLSIGTSSFISNLYCVVY